MAINACFGGFSLSVAAYEKLIEWGVPVRKYIEQERGPDGRYLPQPENDGEVIYDHRLTPPGESDTNDIYWRFPDTMGPYWDSWTRDARTHPLILRVIDELGENANGRHANLRIIEIPDDVEWHIHEYDGSEHVAENHRTWGE